MDRQFLITENVELKTYNLFMTFNLAERTYAAAARSISEVIKLPMLNVPENLPEHIVGIINLRGNIINILDIRKLLGIPEKEYAIDNCVLVITHNEITFGLIVDSVNNVINISYDQISITPYGMKDMHNLIKSVAKTNDGLLGILNLDFISEIVSSTIESFDLPNGKPIKHIPISFHHPNKLLPSFANDVKSLEVFQRRAKDLQNELNLSIEKEKTSDMRFVTFLLNNELYAISLKYIREFSKIINLALIPCVPEFYIGLSNLRGEFIPVLDIKGFLGISKTEITDKSKIIFVRSSKMQIGVLVDEVFDIITVSSEKINKASVLQVDKSKYTSGDMIFDDKQVVNIFDLEKFLLDERLIIEEAV